MKKYPSEELKNLRNSVKVLGFDFSFIEGYEIKLYIVSKYLNDK